MLTSQKRNKKQNSLCPKYTLFIVNVKRFSSAKTGYFLEKVNRRKLLVYKDLGRWWGAPLDASPLLVRTYGDSGKIGKSVDLGLTAYSQSFSAIQ